MARFFTRERFSTPQYIAGFILLIFVAQCAWFIAHAPLNQLEAGYIQSGLLMLKGEGSAGDQYRSPVVPLIASVPISIAMARGDGAASWPDQFYLDEHRWLIRAPFVLMGALLGASLWYVSRRLYGNAAGYIALVLYIFTPGIVARSSLAGPQIPAAWGAFGTIFTAIAVAHTLYAPREVILWNWRRICLLAVAIAMAVGAQFTTAILLVLAMAFMFWAVPHRRAAALAIMASSCALAVLLLWASYLFHIGQFAWGLRHAQWISVSPALQRFPLVFRLVATFFVRESPALSLMMLIALATFAVWRRTRFFGTAAPLLVFGLLVVMVFVTGQGVGLTLLFVALPFIMVFVSGVFADLLESSRGVLALGVALGILMSHALLSLLGLIQLTRR